MKPATASISNDPVPELHPPDDEPTPVMGVDGVSSSGVFVVSPLFGDIFSCPGVAGFGVTFDPPLGEVFSCSDVSVFGVPGISGDVSSDSVAAGFWIMSYEARALRFPLMISHPEMP